MNIPDNIGIMIIQSITETFVDASFYLLFGLLAAGMIKVWVDEKRMVRSLGKDSFGSVLRASMIGIPLPLCSCSVVPMALSIREKGASRGATVSFLISTPETGVDSVAVSYALLDPLMTLFRPVSALITALTAGMIENITSNYNRVLRAAKAKSKTDRIETSCSSGNCGCENQSLNFGGKEISSAPSFINKILAGIKYAFMDMLGDIALYLFFGLLISGVISVFIPENWFVNQPEWLVMGMMLLIGVPVYVCASASTPVAAALILKGVSPGAALIFLLVGPATNIATVSIVGRTLGKRSALYYVASIMAVSLILGIALNMIYSLFDIAPGAVMGSGSELIPEWIKMFSAVGLALLIMVHAYRKIGKTLASKKN